MILHNAGPGDNNCAITTTAGSDLFHLPRFQLDPNQLAIIDAPADFYASLITGIQTAERRVVLSSLYIGSEEKRLISALEEALSSKPDLQISILLDYFRGNRKDAKSPHASCASILAPLVQRFPGQLTVAMYRSPRVSRTLVKIMPQRYIEGVVGLMHIKAYVFDDTLIASGANLSRDYFTNRQDRYISLKVPLLCDYVTDLIRTVSSISYTLLPTAELSAPSVLMDGGARDREEYRTIASKIMDAFTTKWGAKMSTETEAGSQVTSSSRTTTWISPALQMNQLGITTDQTVLSTLLTTLRSSPSSSLTLASAYFNLPTPLQTALLTLQGPLVMLTSSPRANGFYGARGLAGWIPTAYATFLARFCNRAAQVGKQVDVREWTRKGWTWHGKGIWLDGLPSPDRRPDWWTMLIGSSNFNQRSVERDLEMQFYVVSRDEGLKRRVWENLRGLERWAASGGRGGEEGGGGMREAMRTRMIGVVGLVVKRFL